MICPSLALNDIVSHAVSLLDTINPISQKVSSDVPLGLLDMINPISQKVSSDVPLSLLDMINPISQKVSSDVPLSLLDMINPISQKVSSDVPLRLIAEKTLQHIQTGFVDFSCTEHELGKNVYHTHCCKYMSQ